MSASDLRNRSAGLMQLPATISIEQASRLLGISVRSAYKAAHSGELPSLRLGRRLLVPTPKLMHMLGVDQGGSVGSPDPEVRA